MRIQRITIRDVLGIQDLDFQPGAVTVIAGPNGSGKSSTLEAIKGVFAGGHDATLVRNNTQQGEAVIILDEARIDMTVNREETSRTVADSKGKFKRPMEFIKGLVDVFGMNPIDFLTAPAKKAPSSKKPSRTELLLEALPLTVTAAEINKCIPVERKVLQAEIEGSHALMVITTLSEQIFEERTGINRLHTEKEKAFEENRRNLPPEPPGGDWTATLAEKQAELGKLDQGYERAKATIEGDVRVATQAADGTLATDKLRANGEYTAAEREALSAYEEAVRAAAKIRDAALDKATLDRREALQSAASIRDGAVEAANRVATQKLQELDAEIAPKRGELQTAIGEAKARSEQQGEADRAKAYVLRLHKEAVEHKAEADALTSSLTALELLKSKLLEKLPIEGLEVRGDGMIYVDGVGFDRVNESRKVKIAIEIAAMRAGKLPLIIADGLEKLDSTTFAAFEEEMVKAADEKGLQFIVTRVLDQAELTISNVA